MKVGLFGLDGYDLFFHTRESRFEPPHFHITKAGESWKLKVLFTECTEDYLELEVEPDHESADKLPKNKYKELCGLIVKHQAALLQKWDSIVGGQ